MSGNVKWGMSRVGRILDKSERGLAKDGLLFAHTLPERMRDVGRARSGSAAKVGDKKVLWGIKSRLGPDVSRRRPPKRNSADEPF